MSALIHARLDPETQRHLARLRKATGCSDSELVRRGLRALAALPGEEGRRIIGLGAFASGKTDLGSNRRHLRGFGKK
jgi:hypothetical protein